MSKRQKEKFLRKTLSMGNKAHKEHRAHIEDLKKKIVEAETNARKATTADGKAGYSALATAQRKRLDTYIKRTAATFSKSKKKEFDKSIRSQLKINRQKR